jgi:hypothetical protein
MGPFQGQNLEIFILKIHEGSFYLACTVVKTVEAAYAPGSWLDPAWREYFLLQCHCTLCTVPLYKPLCMQ